MNELGSLLPSVGTPPPGPASMELARRLRDVESRNVTRLGDDFPVFWEEARGANVRDADGNVYLDLTGAFGVAVCGHANPRVTERTSAQLARLPHGMGDVHPSEPRVELLERLGALTPWDATRGVLASTGSEAVEVALKTALLATGRPGILAFEGGYHGLTLGSLAATSREDFKEPFRERLYGGVSFAPFPEEGKKGDARRVACLEEVDQILASGGPAGDGVGAVLVEPIQGRAGVRIPPPGFLKGLEARARSAGAVLIVDEVFTGMGRTGAMMAFQHEEGVTPDLVCLGKALGGGLPLSACLGSREVMDAWPESSGEALHTSTFLGHPGACAGALAVLDELEEEGLVDRSREVGEDFLRLLRAALAGVDGVGAVRGRGLFLGVELVTRDGEPREGAGVRVATAALGAGLLVLPAGSRGQVVELAPPLVITSEQVEHGARILGEIVRQEAKG